MVVNCCTPNIMVTLAKFVIVIVSISQFTTEHRPPLMRDISSGPQLIASNSLSQMVPKSYTLQMKLFYHTYLLTNQIFGFFTSPICKIVVDMQSKNSLFAVGSQQCDAKIYS